MIYCVYTDAATKNGTGVSNTAFLVLKGNNHIHTHSELISANDSAVAESAAMSFALKYVNDIVKPDVDDTVVFNSDSLYVIKFCKKCQRSTPDNSDRQVVRPVKNEYLGVIFDEIKRIGYKAKFVWVKSHTKGKSPNSYVDRLAKSGLN